VQVGDYAVALEDGKVVCRNKAGKQLKTVPAKLKDDPAVVGLWQLTDWLERHGRECRDTAERWMVRSLPVPAKLLTEVWPDPAWRAVLRDLVIQADGTAGFLRDADAERGVGVVDLDGDSVRVTSDVVTIPHPVLLEDLADLREFAVELGVEQTIGQLYREVWTKPGDLVADATAAYDFSGGRFAELRFLTGRALGQGYTVRGGDAVCVAFEEGRQVEARMWLGDHDPYYETETGPLSWHSGGGQLKLSEVGPVAWSEGMRMGAALFAGREVEQGAAA
jgi:hypothetical protein